MIPGSGPTALGRDLYFTACELDDKPAFAEPGGLAKRTVYSATARMGDLGTNFARRNGKVAVINNVSLGMVRRHESQPRGARRRAAQHHRLVEVERQPGP